MAIPKVIVFVYILGCVVIIADAIDQSTELLTRLQVLENYAKKQDRRILSLEQELSTNQQQLSKFVSVCESLFDRTTPNASVSVAAPQLKRRVRSASISRRAPAQQVAFSAYLDHKVDHISLESIIPFNQVILNDGGAYNTITGIFTVPVSGVYLFHYSLLTDHSVWQLVVKLVLDNVNMSDGTSDPFHSGQEIQGGNTVLFRANRGQSVWLAAYNTANTLVSGREDYRFSTFSGALLYTY